MIIHELRYSNTNTYLIEGKAGKLLFDTGWACTFSAFCRYMGELGIRLQDIDYILISHFHPDHMGIAQEISSLGAVIIVMDVQDGFVHNADNILKKEKGFCPIDDERTLRLRISESRDFLKDIGIDGEILHTPGHSDDSISLVLDSGEIFVGDLNPLYELELHSGTKIEESWNSLLAMNPTVVYYGHAKTLRLNKKDQAHLATDDLYKLVSDIMKCIDKNMPFDKIRKKTWADMTFIEDVARMYLTHQNVGVQGILDRIEIKGK